MIVTTLFILKDIKQMFMDAILQIVNITLTERARYVMKLLPGCPGWTKKQKTKHYYLKLKNVI